ncbi:hypothetical protein AGR56_11650 [Clostridium sp. DMHC 10]|uniref:helix-turn-helix domain-containing protein n=1 Tax=Clostridium sp. DMHC 10 TaxID=747377 RepID=UPI00069DD868|nr:helix-turn-helix transcriptional regulator [Clostridium sp. DMHC 10]KOF57150.1 hypothetical protein AGR56_11650 [Clostridium sp. DMHC 10]
MSFGDFLKNLRNENNMSQRELSEKSGISNAEISRIELGERKKPSPMALKAFAPYLGVSYQELLKQAGYIEEIVEHEGFTENIYKDENGHLIDIVRRAKDMYEKNSDWVNLAYRVTASDLSEAEVQIIKAQTELLLNQFLKNKSN